MFQGDILVKNGGGVHLNCISAVMIFHLVEFLTDLLFLDLTFVNTHIPAVVIHTHTHTVCRIYRHLTIGSTNTMQEQKNQVSREQLFTTMTKTWKVCW